jgi:hypothetical protein
MKTFNKIIYVFKILCYMTLFFTLSTLWIESGKLGIAIYVTFICVIIVLYGEGKIGGFTDKNAYYFISYFYVNKKGDNGFGESYSSCTTDTPIHVIMDKLKEDGQLKETSTIFYTKISKKEYEMRKQLNQKNNKNNE